MIIDTLKSWCHYLLSSCIMIQMDHELLKYIHMQKTLSLHVACWLDILEEYDYTIKYIPGMKNTIADSLSHHSELTVLMISITSDLLGHICEATMTDDFAHSIHEKLTTPSVHPSLA